MLQKFFFEGRHFRIYLILRCLRATKDFIEGIHNQYNTHSMLDDHCYNKLRHQNCCTQHYCFHHRTMNLQPSLGSHIQPLGQCTYYDQGCEVFSHDFQIYRIYSNQAQSRFFKVLFTKLTPTLEFARLK